MQIRLTSFWAITLALSLATAPYYASAKDPDVPDVPEKGERADNCQPHFVKTEENQFRLGLIRALDGYVTDLEKNRTELESALHHHLDQRKSLLGKSQKPQIAPSTMLALLSAYDYDKQPSIGRLTAMQQARQKLESDPYFLWLTAAHNADLSKLIEFFLQPLNTGGSANLKLSYALLRLRAALEPGFDSVAKASVISLLVLTALEHSASQDLQTLRYIDTNGAWDLAQSLEQARSNRKTILSSIRMNSPNKISMSDYEKLKAFLHDENPDTEILRRYCLAVDGILKGKIDQKEMEFLKKESERIREDSGLSNRIVFNAEFVGLWPSIWGAGLSYDRVLLRHFYQPEADRYKLDSQLYFLNFFIELAEEVQSKALKNKYYQEKVKANLSRFPYLHPFIQ